MEAVISYQCACGNRVLVCLEPPAGEDGPAKARLDSTAWNEKVKEIADRIGARFVDQREAGTFACAECSRVHVRATAGRAA